MSTAREHRKQFVRRLIEACDKSALVPQPNMGRQVFIAQNLGVSNEAVNKWFKGTSTPRPPKMKELAELLGVDVAWLTLGIDPESDRKGRMLHGRQADGAAHLVFGMMMFAGIQCGVPSETDPRSSYVDFYAMVGTSVYPIRVSLGREIGPNEYEFFIIPEFKEVRTIGVVPLGNDSFHFLELDVDNVDRLKSGGAPAYRLVVKREASEYHTGDHTWKVIRKFKDLC